MSFTNDKLYRVTLVQKNLARIIETNALISKVLNVTESEARSMTQDLPFELICGLSLNDAICLDAKFNKLGSKVDVTIDKESTEQNTSIDISKIKIDNEIPIGKSFNQGNSTSGAITCPYCHSTNVEKITLGKRAVKGFLWGAAAANTLVKEWHCKNCKSNF